MQSVLSTHQEWRLVWNLLKWARVLDAIAQAVGEFAPNLLKLHKEMNWSDLNQDQQRQLSSVIFAAPADAHMIAICLRQINEFVEQLKQSSLWTGAVKEKGRLFQRLFTAEEIIDLRDVLEHGAEYIAGKGSKPHLVEDLDGDWPGVLCINGRPIRITVFGRSYEIKPVVLAAIELAKVLPKKDELPPH
jgi:hypothetical protein